MNINPATLPTFLIAGALFYGGYRLHPMRPRLIFVLGTALALPCVLAVLFYTHLFDRAAWFYEARTLSLSELTFSGIGLLGGAVYRWLDPENWREHIFEVIITACFLLIPFVKPLSAPLDTSLLRDRCEGAVCLQSSPSTCGPASAATILHSFGDPVSEKELAQESFTYIGGTEAWNLARAIQKHGHATKFVFRDDSLPSPAIAGVVLPGGMGHFIAVLDVSPSSVTIVDPAAGKITMGPQELRKNYRFTGFFLTVSPSRH
jgi:hypothetical protein